MFTPDAFVQFIVHAGEVAAVAVSLPANKLRHLFVLSATVKASNVLEQP